MSFHSYIDLVVKEPEETTELLKREHMHKKRTQVQTKLKYT